MKTKVYFTSVVVLCYSWNVILAQSFNLEPFASDKTLIGLKASLPGFKNSEGMNVKAMSGTYTLYSAIPISPKWSLYAELPFIAYMDEYQSETGLGNIFLTVRAALNEKKTSQISLGMFLPTISESNYSLAGMGLFSNYYRISQFTQAYTIYGNYSSITSLEKDWILGVEIGPEVVIPKEEDYDTEIWFHFSLLAGYRIDKLSLWAEFNDIIFASQLDAEIDFNDRNINQIVFCGQYNFGVIRPALCYMLPLKDELNDIQTGAIGFKVDFNF
jgi:hypothetical protein